MVEIKDHSKSYSRGAYWAKRSDLLYYKYVDYVIRTVARDATSLVDIGTGNSPYLEWFDWIDDKASVDIANPYESENVRPIEGNILDIKLDKTFDFCTCLQVLEHVEKPKEFARRLFEIANHVVISVPYMWTPGTVKGHVNDPVSLQKLTSWVGKEPNYYLRVKEPFRKRNAERLIAVYLGDNPPMEGAFNFNERRAERVKEI